MNRDQAEALVARLHLAYPRQVLRRAHYALYAEVFLPQTPEVGALVVDEATATYTWFPAVSELYDVLAEVVIGAPGSMEAWELAANGADPAHRHPLVARAMYTMGGSYAIKTTSNPVGMRKQFIQAYEEWLQRARHAVRTQGNWRDIARLPEPRRRQVELPAPEPSADEIALVGVEARRYMQTLREGQAGADTP